MGVQERVLCPWLKEANPEAEEVCDFEDMFHRPPDKEDCLHCLAGMLDWAKDEASRYRDLASLVRRFVPRLPSLIEALRDGVSTSEAMRIVKLSRPDVMALLHFMGAKAIKRGRGYRWRLEE